MPGFSRRKQSKPQHLANDKDEDEKKAGNQTNTSALVPIGNQSTQEVHVQYGLKVKRHERQPGTVALQNGFVTLSSDEDNGDLIINEGDTQNLEEPGDTGPADLSSKVKVTDNDLDLSGSSVDDSCSSPVRLGRHECLPSDCSTETKDVYEQHLIEDSKEPSVHCSDCNLTFKSQSVLQHHLFMTHDILSREVNIAQHVHDYNRKRPLDTDDLPFNSTNPANHDLDPDNNDADSAYSKLSPMEATDMASKRHRGDFSSPTPQNHCAILPHLSETSYDSHMRAYEASLKSPANETTDPHSCHLTTNEMTDPHSCHVTANEMTDLHNCQVCAKMFPKPSDLKRHMMCHTGEKPFRCRFCSKPFRAKSSMHYHLKATHGIDIELSPGLEERYLRMKTRAQMHLLQRGHLTGLPQLYGSESANYRKENLDDEDDAKSMDSFYQNSDIGSDLISETKSQGYVGQTGNNSKFALDLSMSGRNKLFNGNTRPTSNGVVVSYGEGPFNGSKLSVQNETVVVSRLDGLDLMYGEYTSVFKCHLCGNMFQSLNKLQTHLSIHTTKHRFTYECCYCDESFHFKTQMRSHIRRRHSSAMSRLTYAKDSIASFITNNHLPAGSSFSCRFCHKGFGNAISFNKHTRLHMSNKRYTCRICGKNFCLYTSMQIHISRFHLKTAGEAKCGSSWVRRKLNLVKARRIGSKHQDLENVQNTARDEPLNLMNKSKYQNTSVLPNQNVTIVLPRSPTTADGDISDVADAGFSQHSSDNNWSESLSEGPLQDTDEADVEIRTAPKRSLMPLKRDLSPRGRSSKKTTPVHAYENHTTSDNDLPLNFSKSDRYSQDNNNNSDASDGIQTCMSPELSLPVTPSNPETIMPGYALNSTNHLLMVKALAAHQSLTHHLNNTSQPIIFPPNHLPPSLAAMSQMMSLPMSSTPLMSDPRAGTSKSPSPASHSSSKSDTSPEDRDSKDDIRESILGYPRIPWGQENAGSLWSFNMYSPPDAGHADGRKVTSLSRTHSRLGIVQSPINRESMCKATTLTDGRTVYKCPFCSKEFVSFSDINRHMDFHEDIRPYKCHYCDYYARTNSQLKVHMMRHQGIREFCCKLCNYKGVTQSDLNRHMKSQIHMLKSRNACSYCGEGFVTSKNLEKHLDGNCIVKMQKLNGGLDLPLQERVA